MTQGCMPFALPPTRLRASVGPTIGRHADGQDGGTNAQFSGAIHPLQAVRAAQKQPLDVGVGWGVEAAADDGRDALVHGPELELGYYPVRSRNGGNEVRLGAFTAAELLFAEGYEGPPGYGATVGANVELTGFSEGKFEGDGIAGGYLGQWAVGLFLATSHRAVGHASYQTVMLGVSGRIPFVGGVACCATPGSGDIPSSSGDSSTSDDDDHQQNRNHEPAHEAPERIPARPTPERRVERTPANPRPR